MRGLLERLGDWMFGRPPSSPPALRNKPGGMAWIHKAPFYYKASKAPAPIGQHVIIGLPVKCLRLDTDRCWWIEPPVEFMVTGDFTYTESDTGILRSAKAGQVAIVRAIHDDFLLPWKDDGGVSDADVRELYRSDLVRPVRRVPASPVQP